jgi:hypothetical protein
MPFTVACGRRGSNVLSVCIATNEPCDRLAVVLSTLREAEFPQLEIVLALDDRTEGSHHDYARIVDRTVLFPFAAPPDRIQPWLATQCSGDWTLRLDGDEVPSRGLVDQIAELVAGEPGLTHAWMPCRWLYPSADRYLAEWPWRPDYQLRLFRNDRAVVRSTGLMHRHTDVVGARRYLTEPLYHSALLLRSREQREEKVARYEATSPEVRVAGDSVSRRFYLPELLTSVRTSPVPEADLDLTRRLLTPPTPTPATAPAPGELSRVSRGEVDALWSGRPLVDADYAARLELLDHDLRVFRGETRTIDVRAYNLGSVVWPWGERAEPPIRLAQRWRLFDGTVVEGLRTPFPEPVLPGASCVVPAQVGPPPDDDELTLEIDIVHEHVRWFGSALLLVVERG